jgi:hypothetical protein
MTEQAAAVESGQAAPAIPQIINPQTAPKGSEGTEHVDQNPGKEKWGGPSLFADETITDAVLRDGEPPKEEKPAGEQKETPDATAKAGEAEGQPPAEPGKVAEKEAKPDDKKADAAAEKPPAGYVPLAALHEERGKRQKVSEENAFLFNQNTELRAELDSSRQAIEAMQAEGKVIPRGPGAGFKVLSKPEFEELKDNDPTAAVEYLYDLQIFQEQRKAAEQHMAAATSMVQAAYREISEDIPEIYAEDGAYAGKLIEFAAENGIPKQLLPVLTNPNTVVQTNSSKAPVILGNGAAALVRFINNMYKARGAENVEALREQIRADLETEVTAKIMEKIKKAGKADFRDLDVPTDGSATDRDTMQPITEESYARMTDADRRKFLGG